MNKLVQNQDVVKVKFNAMVTPKMAYNKETGKFESEAVKADFRKDLIKLMTEEGDTPEETAMLKSKKTGTLINRGMISVSEAMDLLYGSAIDGNKKQFYYKDEIVELPKQLADYYTTLPCGGNVIMRTANGVEQTTYKANIDNQAQMYKDNEIARYEREHQVIMVAEVYNG